MFCKNSHSLSLLALLLAVVLALPACTAFAENGEQIGFCTLSVRFDDTEYPLNMALSGVTWYVNAEDLAKLGDLRTGITTGGDQAYFLRGDRSVILYTGDYIVINEKVYVPAQEATIACGLRFADYDGQLVAERCRTPKDLEFELSNNVFSVSQFKIYEFMTNADLGTAFAMALGKDYSALTDGFMGVLRLLTGEADRLNYEKAMRSLLVVDETTLKYLSDIKSAAQLLTNADKWLSKGEKATNEILTWIYTNIYGMTDSEAEWQVFLDGLDVYGDLASLRYFLEDFGIAVSLIKNMGEFDAISKLLCTINAEASVVVSMDTAFSGSENPNIRNAASSVMKQYNQGLPAAASAINDIAKTTLTTVVDEAYEGMTAVETLGNPAIMIWNFVQTAVLDKGLNVDDKAEFLTYVSVYSDLQLDIASSYYEHLYDDNAGALLRGFGIMYLNAAVKVYDLLSFDASIDLSSTKENAKNLLAELLSYEDYEFEPNYDNAVLITYAQKNRTQKDGAQDAEPTQHEAKIGDGVFWGHYEQDNNLNNGEEPIEWIVQDRRADGSVVLLSKCALDCKPYNTERVDVTWETCTLRKWLNEDFYNAAFSAQEQAKIVPVTLENADNPHWGTTGGNATLDRVWLLSINEVFYEHSIDKVFSCALDEASRMCAPTKFAVAQGIDQDSYFTIDGVSTCWWWLRSPGRASKDAADVDTRGDDSYYGLDVDYGHIGVRPAIVIQLGSEGEIDTYTSAGNTSTEHSNTETVQNALFRYPIGADVQQVIDGESKLSHGDSLETVMSAEDEDAPINYQTILHYYDVDLYGQSAAQVYMFDESGLCLTACYYSDSFDETEQTELYTNVSSALNSIYGEQHPIGREEWKTLDVMATITARLISLEENQVNAPCMWINPDGSVIGLVSVQEKGMSHILVFCISQEFLRGIMDAANSMLTETTESTVELETDSVEVSYNVGDIVYFGHYEQDNDLSNGQEPIEWIVLSVDDDNIRLLSKYALDAVCYNETTDYNLTWENSSIRQWLNIDFYYSAFSETEQKCIITSRVRMNYDDAVPGNDTYDKVFLLNTSDALAFFENDEARKCYPTEYAKIRGAYVDPNVSTTSYWHISSGGDEYPDFIGSDGYIYWYTSSSVTDVCARQNIVLSKKAIQKGHYPEIVWNNDGSAIYNGHKYLLFSQKASWDEAKSICESYGGHLATITSMQEQAFIEEYLWKFAGDEDIWIGINADWNYWITGEPTTYTNWAFNEPDCWGNEQFFGSICNGEREDGSGSSYYHILPGQWDDLGNINLRFLCEWDTVSDLAVSASYSVGDTVVFGHYEQDNDLANGAEPIEWIVMDAPDDSTLLLISHYGLDSKPFDNEIYSNPKGTLWMNCSLRNWLNGDFYYNSFTPEEQKMILELERKERFDNTIVYDRVSIIQDRDEVYQYFLDREDRICYPTQYTLSQNVKVDQRTGSCSWWLICLNTGAGRASAGDVYDTSYVDEYGIGSTSIDTIGIGIRPIIKIDMSRLS